MENKENKESKKDITAILYESANRLCVMSNMKSDGSLMQEAVLNDDGSVSIVAKFYGDKVAETVFGKSGGRNKYDTIEIKWLVGGKWCGTSDSRKAKQYAESVIGALESGVVSCLGLAANAVFSQPCRKTVKLVEKL